MMLINGFNNVCVKNLPTLLQVLSLVKRNSRYILQEHVPKLGLVIS